MHISEYLLNTDTPWSIICLTFLFTVFHNLPMFLANGSLNKILCKPLGWPCLYAKSYSLAYLLFLFFLYFFFCFCSILGTDNEQFGKKDFDSG